MVVDYNLLSESLPHRKPRCSKKRPDIALTDSQRIDNAVHACCRIKVQYALKEAKRLGCITQIYRNKFFTFKDWIMALACGIWNLRLIKKEIFIREQV